MLNFFVLTMTVAGFTILWRTVKDDHPQFNRWVRDLPFIGESLSCGVCVAYWFSLPVAIAVTVVPGWPSEVPYSGFATVSAFIVEWITLGTSVLLVRSTIIVLLEAGATLKHRHRATHDQVNR